MESAIVTTINRFATLMMATAALVLASSPARRLTQTTTISAASPLLLSVERNVPVHSSAECSCTNVSPPTLAATAATSLTPFAGRKRSASLTTTTRQFCRHWTRARLWAGRWGMLERSTSTVAKTRSTQWCTIPTTGECTFLVAAHSRSSAQSVLVATMP